MGTIFYRQRVNWDITVGLNRFLVVPDLNGEGGLDSTHGVGSETKIRGWSIGQGIQKFYVGG